MEADLNVIPASRFSLAELTEAYNQTRIDYIVPMPMTAKRLREYVETYDVDIAHSCAAIDDVEPGLVYGIGMLGVREKRSWITRLGVLPYARRLGTGGQIMNYLIDRSYKIGVEELWLEVIAGNAPAHRMFVKKKFEQTRELIVARRSPNAGLPPASECPSVDSVEILQRLQMFELLEQRKHRPNWLNQTETFRNVAKLNGFRMDVTGCGRGWLIYESTPFQLKRVIVEVIEGDEAEVSLGMLCWLHKRLPTLDAVSENIPTDDPKWAAYEHVGYFDSFHRVEMVRRMR